MKAVGVLILGLVLTAPSLAQSDKSQGCKPVTLYVIDEPTRGLDLTPKEYLQCILRGDSAKTLIRNLDQAHTPYPQNGYDKDWQVSLFAWEFPGDRVNCAARTSAEEKMATLELMLQNLPEAEALCKFFIDPVKGQIEVPHMPQEESSAGVSNHFLR